LNRQVEGGENETKRKGAKVLMQKLEQKAFEPPSRQERQDEYKGSTTLSGG